MSTRATTSPGVARAHRSLRHPRLRLELGSQRVYAGTSEDLSFLADGSVDLVVTSPPYFDSKVYGADGEIGQEDYPTYLERLCAVFAECYRVARPGAVLVVDVAPVRRAGAFFNIPSDLEARMPLWRQIDRWVWWVPNALPQAKLLKERYLDNKHEALLVFVRDGAEHTFHKPRVPQKYAGRDRRAAKLNPLGRCLGNVLRIPAWRPPNVRQRNYHQAAFPEELPAFVLECFSDPGDVVLDPFCGSGTTLKVAEAMGRRGVGIEIVDVPESFDLVAERIDETFVVPDWRRIDAYWGALKGTVSGPRKPRRTARPA